MKHSYSKSGIFHAIQTLGIFLTSLTLLTSCSNELEGFSSTKEENNSNITTSKDDSVLRFLTIDELENISIAEIPGNHDGYELKELSYQCVDTIELRALRFDVTAKLRSSANQDKVVSFSAEVGPELVSVEYYPSAEITPPHHNLVICCWPKVERYRNYSDGSRIGPDEFYDYGHNLGASIYTYLEDSNPSLLSYDLKTIPAWIGSNVNSEMQYYENGIYYQKQKGVIEQNLNTTLIETDGSSFCGEDLFFLNISHIYDMETFQNTSTQWGKDYYNRNGAGYSPSREYNEEIFGNMEILSCCSEVPDVSPIPYPNDTESLKPGWYYCPFFDGYDDGFFLFPKYAINKDRLDWIHGVRYNWDVYGYMQYLVIDNRIIHFENIAFKDYNGIETIKPQIRTSKTSDGYLIKTEIETKLYGEKFKSVYDLQIKGVNGSSEVIDLSIYDDIWNNDYSELENLHSQDNQTRSADSDKKIVRLDGKSVSIDQSLPHSLRSIKNTRTISLFSR